MKKGPLSNKEKEFIDNNHSMDIKDISEKLDRSEKVLARYMEISESPRPNLFATKPERGVVIMTENASMAADESRPKRTTTAKRYEEGVIHQIKDK
jgi:hypothetical protein